MNSILCGSEGVLEKRKTIRKEPCHLNPTRVSPMLMIPRTENTINHRMRFHKNVPCVWWVKRFLLFEMIGPIRSTVRSANNPPISAHNIHLSF